MRPFLSPDYVRLMAVLESGRFPGSVWCGTSESVVVKDKKEFDMSILGILAPGPASGFRYGNASILRHRNLFGDRRYQL